MQHAVIVAHPSASSFNLSVANAYCKAARERSFEVRLRDLYRMQFAPCLAQNEIVSANGFAPHPDVVEERTLLAATDIFAFVYPFWLNSPPAILKGYLERVFGLGFAYNPRPGGGTQPLLTGRKMMSFSSSGAPTDWVANTGALDATRKLFDEHFAAVCGLTVVDHIHFGGIVPGMRRDAVERHLDRVREIVATKF